MSPTTDFEEAFDWGGMNSPVIEKFRAGTEEDAHLFYGQPILLLTTTGAKSGKKRVNPLVSLIDDGRVYVIASKGGSPENPDWYHNVRANPDVTVEMPDETFEATAVEVADTAERDRLYAGIAARFSNFAEYQEQTDRRIPVVELVRK
jgi:deazaflavin-dependent oxidoreductase (nitroreductase family)